MLETIRIDFIIISCTLACFVVFILFQFIIFRFTKQKNVINSLIMITLSAFIFVNLMCYIFINLSGIKIEYSVGVIIFAMLMVLLIYGLLVYLYSLYVFGVNESSIRIRLLREISDGQARGILLSDLSKRYNDDVIINTRINRLLSSGEIKLKNGKYCMGNSFGIFALQSFIIYKLKKVLQNK